MAAIAKREMKNILVTGGAGFIGSNFVRYLLQSRGNIRIVNVDLLTYAGNRANLAEFESNSNYVFVHRDVCDGDLILDLLGRYEIDTVVHFAAESHVDRSISASAPFVRTNVLGTLSLLEACRAAWLEEASLLSGPVRFHHVSTDEIYGSLEAEDQPWTESSPYAPNSPYSASKAGSDHLVRAYGHTYGLPCTISNCSNNYGPYQLPEKLIPLMIVNALKSAPLPIYGDGGQIRDWLYVEDHVQAIVSILESGAPNSTYNIGGGNQPTNLELVTMVCKILDEVSPPASRAPRTELITHVADRQGHDRRYAIDHTKISGELGWQPLHSLEAGLRKTVAWYLDHMDWVEAVVSREDYKAWMDANYARRGEVR